MNALDYRSLIQLTLVLSAAGGVLGLLAVFARFLMPVFASRSRLALAGEGPAVAGSAPAAFGQKVLQGASRLLVGLCLAALVANVGAMVARYLEVRHWPAQTMYEVLPLGTCTGFLSTLILYYVLGLHRLRGIARGFGDLFVALLLVGAAFTLKAVLGLDPSGRPLPPALQSYWFSTHITAYMFGYFTFFIATLATWLLFCFKFWRGLLDPGYEVPRRTLWAIGAFTLIPVPFGVQGILLGPGVLLLTGLVVLAGRRSPGRLAWLDAWEKGGDDFTWKIFLVGFPFLTAGLIQGGLWAQEAWATYWGWDSKEVSALISWIFYAVYLHMRYVVGWRGEKSMWILLFGGLSVYITFQLFGFLPASQSSLHRYTDMSAVPAEGLLNPGGGPVN